MYVDDGSRADHGGSDDHARLDRDRELGVTSAAALRNIALALFRSGFDPRDQSDMQRYSDMLRRQREAEDRTERKGLFRNQVFLAALTAAFTIFATWATGFVPWLTRLIPEAWRAGGGHS
jgi:hypothetical protein